MIGFDIQTRHFALTEAMRSRIGRRLCSVPGTRCSRVRRTQVRPSDNDGLRGANDNSCQLSVVLPGRATVVSEDNQSDLYVVIDRAADRASRTFKRKLLSVSSCKRSHLPEGQYALDGLTHTEFVT